MIVCHCNRISANDIEEAVCCLKTNCPNHDLCPRTVYEELGVGPRCCNCFPLAERMIHEASMKFVSREELATDIPLPIAR